jgi:hypothetical protein
MMLYRISRKKSVTFSIAMVFGAMWLSHFLQLFVLLLKLSCFQGDIIRVFLNRFLTRSHAST